MSADSKYSHGPYTVADLHSLLDDGKTHELVDGWLIEVPQSIRHDYLAKTLACILERAAEDCGADSDPIILEETGVLEVSDPFPISFSLSRLTDFS